MTQTVAPALAEALAAFPDFAATAGTTGFGGAAALGSWIGGRMVAGEGEAIAVRNPANGAALFAYRDAGPGVARAAAETAATARAAWAGLTPAGRGRLLWEAGRAVRAAAEPLARLESLSAGKPIRDTRVEVARVAEMLEYYAGWCDKLHGEVIPVPTGHLTYTRREPYGVVLQITPWNAPVFTAGWQIAPALAAGNTVVLKPSELTPLSSLALVMLAERAGLPPGAVNVLAGHGRTTGQAALAAPEVAKVVFVGSVPTGRAIAEAAARRLIPCLLELGGKSANIVFADADLERAALGAQAAIFSGAGQSCVAGSRLLVERSIHDRFVERVARGAERLRLGDPADAATEVGPIGNARQYDRVCEMTDAAQVAGARLVTGGPIHGPGYFFRPTVLAGVDNRDTIAREEVFGPVVCAIPFDDEADAIAIANDSPFGLAGAVWTRDVARAHRVAAAVEAGTVWINAYKTIHVSAPFGGYRASGYGRSSGQDALAEYTRVKSVWVETAAAPAAAFGYAPAAPEDKPT